MDKIEARRVLMTFARHCYRVGWSWDEFMETFELVQHREMEIERQAYDLVPDVLEHIAHFVWKPIDYTR